MSNIENYQNASRLDIAKIYAYLIKLNLRKKTRNYSLIDEEYNSGKWNRQFEEIDFETLSGNYDRKDVNEFNIVVIDGKLKKVLRKDYEIHSNAEFLSFFKNYFNDSIIELGCGLGAHLFSLYNAGFKKLSGCDLSVNAINNLKKYTKIKDIDIDFDVCDLNNEFPENFIHDKIVFTYTCLEQCKHIMSNVLQNIIKGKPKLVIHFEVDYDSSPLMVKNYFDSCDYQNNLVRELKKLEKENKIEILSIQKLNYAGTPVNRRSSIMWKLKH